MAGQYSRSSSSESAVPMIRTNPGTGVPANSKLILGAVIGGVALLLSIVSTAGVFVYFTREISKVADNSSKKHIIKAAMDNVPVDVFKSAVEFDDKPAHRPSAHLTVQFGSPQDMSHHLDRSCRHLVKWGIGKGLSYIQNMTIHHGKLRASQTGRYYIYAQTYFRYQHKAIADYEDYSAKSNEQQLVQCIYKMTSTYASPILLMKGVGTKCWAANAEYGLNSIYQGGLFELKAGDEIFVTISDIKLVDDNVASSYFGSFRLDM
ncbi:tumor necrosis factor ligand superfamily member 10-like isoform X2 [Cetorhinus maximus]